MSSICELYETRNNSLNKDKQLNAVLVEVRSLRACLRGCLARLDHATTRDRKNLPVDFASFAPISES